MGIFDSIFGGKAKKTPHEIELEKRATEGDIDAIQELATITFNREDYESAASWALTGAGYNDAWCMHLIGRIAYDNKNYAESMKWYEKNVNINNYSLSATELGFMYLNLDDNPQLPTDAYKANYYFDLAVRGDPSNGDAALGLAFCLIGQEDSNVNRIRSLLQTAINNSVIEGNKNLARELLSQIS